MDTVLFLLLIRGLKPLLVFYLSVEDKFPGGKFREFPFVVDIIFAGGNSENVLHAKNLCYAVLSELHS